jgi:hypothetical protein
MKNKLSIIILVFFLILSINFISAKTAVITKNGYDFSSSTGAYVKPGQCGNICSWIVQNQVIIGAADSNYTKWGGTLKYDFDLSKYNNIHSVKVLVEWPHYRGKGLHSPSSTGGGSISINQITNVIKKYSLNYPCSPSSDKFSTQCGTWSSSVDIPKASIKDKTKVFLTANSKSAWDVAKVSLVVNYG